MRYTISKIESEMSAAGSHWWDRDSQRFFKCRVGEQVYQGPGGIYFVTSERCNDSPRQYSVRQYMPARKNIETIGDFNSMTRSVAHRTAKEMASTNLQSQFDDAMCALDQAITEKHQIGESKYVSIYDARQCGSSSIMYLSDGGYTRVSVSEYDDGSGYMLRVIPTFLSDAKNDEIRQRFSAAYDLQREVCRILRTESAGDEMAVTSEIYVEATPAQQLALDIVRNGGRCSNKVAGDLIKYAKQHHKMMEDYCNGIEIYDEDAEPKAALRNLRRRIDNVAAKCLLKASYSGDPRGCTVKLIMPNGETNDWGKEGWCVPTS